MIQLKVGEVLVEASLSSKHVQTYYPESKPPGKQQPFSTTQFAIRSDTPENERVSSLFFCSKDVLNIQFPHLHLKPGPARGG